MEPAEEAKRKGWHHVGWGYWANDKGEVMARTENNQLVLSTPDAQANQKSRVSSSTIGTSQSPTVVDAMEFAIQAHGDQKYGEKPYEYHLRKVVGNAWRNGGNITSFIVAWLHDVVEDTNVTLPEIAQRYGVDVADFVDLLTNVKGPNGKTDKATTFKRIRTKKMATFVKLCDRLANVSEGEKLDMYRKAHPLFKSILYIPGEFDNLWNQIEERLNT